MKKLSIMLFTVILMCSFFIQGHAIKYIDGRFITNTKVHKCIEKMIVPLKRYKEILGENKIYFDRINFSFIYSKQNNAVKKIELYIPVIDEDSAITFFIDLYPKKNLYTLELVTLFLNSNEFNEQNFNFYVHDSVNIGGWEGNSINEYDYRYSIFTDITEENWREKCLLNPDVIWECTPHSLLFLEIRPGEKVFVDGYDENYEE